MGKIVLLALTLGLLVSCSGPSAEQDSTARTGPTSAATGETATKGGMTSPSSTVASPRNTTESSGPGTTAAVAEALPNPEGATRSESTATSPAVGENGMVSTANPLATEAGLQVLADGGNAYDAAVTVAAALGVVEPMMNGIGGYGATVIYDAKSGETRFLGASSRVPETLDLSVFYPPTPGYVENRSGAASISTPGAVNDWEALWEEYGSLGWDRLLQPAIGYAEDGFTLNTENATWISSEYDNFPAHAREIYGSNGGPLQAGETLVQEDLGDSLRLISEEGAGAVYGGELGEAMASAAQANGGFLTTDDLQRNEAEWKPTIGMDYRGQRVVTAPPPNTSWNSLTRLGVMNQFDPASLGQNSTSYLDLFARVTEQAYYERQQYAADPEVERTPLDRLLSENYWADQAAAIDPALASSGKPESEPVEQASATEIAKNREHTTHFVVADKEGNVVSMTQTLGNIFGSRVMPEGTGIWLNNSISYARFDATDGSFNVVPGGYRLPGISPTLVMRDGKPSIALGTHGGYYITQTTPQMLMNLIDFDMDIQQAITAPRIAFMEPDSLAVDPTLPDSVFDELVALGYAPYVDEYGLGNAHGLAIEYGPDGKPVRFTGGADPRSAGLAVGF
ncbi:MAG: gamma-glutamyltransferase [Rubrobacteraceae bacterium]